MTTEMYSSKTGKDIDTVRSELESVRQKLITARQTRTLPRDDKLLSGWNGLALSAFVAASDTFSESSYRSTANALRNFLVDSMWDGNALSRSLADGELLGSAALEDYAYVGRGLIDWARFTDSRQDLEIAMQITKDTLIRAC